MAEVEERMREDEVVDLVCINKSLVGQSSMGHKIRNGRLGTVFEMKLEQEQSRICCCEIRRRVPWRWFVGPGPAMGEFCTLPKDGGGDNGQAEQTWHVGLGRVPGQHLAQCGRLFPLPLFKCVFVIGELESAVVIHKDNRPRTAARDQFVQKVCRPKRSPSFLAFDGGVVARGFRLKALILA